MCRMSMLLKNQLTPDSQYIHLLVPGWIAIVLGRQEQSSHLPGARVGMHHSVSLPAS